MDKSIAIGLTALVTTFSPLIKGIGDSYAERLSVKNNNSEEIGYFEYFKGNRVQSLVMPTPDKDTLRIKNTKNGVLNITFGGVDQRKYLKEIKEIIGAAAGSRVYCGEYVPDLLNCLDKIKRYMSKGFNISESKRLMDTNVEALFVDYCMLKGTKDIGTIIDIYKNKAHAYHNGFKKYKELAELSKDIGNKSSFVLKSERKELAPVKITSSKGLEFITITDESGRTRIISKEFYLKEQQKEIVLECVKKLPKDIVDAYKNRLEDLCEIYKHFKEEGLTDISIIKDVSDFNKEEAIEMIE